MKLSRRGRSRLLVLASIAAPVLASQGMRLLGGGPAVSSASITPAPAPAGAVGLWREPEPTPEQTRALQWLRLRVTDQSARCPMQQVVVVTDTPVVVDPQPPVQPQVRTGPDPLTALTVSAVMTGENGGLARINGKIYPKGSSPLAGWTITLIDRDRRLVQVTGPEGRVVDLYMKRPDLTGQPPPGK